MSFLVLIFRSAFRNRLRTMLTAVGVAIAIIAFLFLRTFIHSWYAGVENAATDRMIVRNKTALIFPLPLAYVERVRSVPGVSDVAYENWFGAYFKDEREFFANLAADDNVLNIYPEIEISDEQKRAYMEDRTGCIVGPNLLKKYNWKVGEKITLKGTIYPGDWDMTIRGTYKAGRNTIDESTLFFHWKYLNERMDETRKNQVGFLLIRIDNPGRSNEVQQTIDKMFANSPYETRTESEKAFQLEFVSMSSQIIAAIQVVSFVVLIILMLILGNTLAMATRERT